MALQTGPDATNLLSEALEKLLYLESRLEAAEAARDDAARERDRQRAAVSEARRSAVDWQRRASAAEAAAEGAEREVALLRAAVSELQKAREAPPETAALVRRLHEAEERLVRFAREREAWIDRMVATERLRGAGAGDDELDLGSFIAEMREELMALRRGEPSPGAARGGPPPLDARKLVEEAPAPPPDPAALLAGAPLTRQERTLALLCARDLESPSAAVRRRAIERLDEAGIGALDVLVVARLADEPDPAVRAAAARLLGRNAGEGASLALGRALGDPDARVRAAAVKALAGRAPYDVGNALTDESPAVRRLAVSLLPRGSAAVDRLAEALADDDASVRRVAALALCGRAGPEAAAVLRVAARSGDAETAKLARESLLRRGIDPDEPFEVPAAEPVAQDEAPAGAAAAAAAPEEAPASGEPVSVDLAPEAAAEPAAPEPAGDAAPGEARADEPGATEPAADQPAAIEAAAEAAPAEAAAQPGPAVETPAAPEPGMEDAEAAVWALGDGAPATPAPQPDDALAEALLHEVRSSLRGRTIEELVAYLGRGTADVAAAAVRLAGEGRLVWRGAKLYQP